MLMKLSNFTHVKVFKSTLSMNNNSSDYFRNMMKYVLLVLTIFIVSCNAQTGIVQNFPRRNHSKFPYHHGLYHYGLTHYWLFLAVKAKIIFLIGTFISFWLFAGKAFAFLYYIRNKESCKCPEYRPEKVVVADEPHYEPHYEHKYSTIFNSDPPLNYHPSFYGKKPFISTYERYSRSIEDSIFPHMNILKRIISKLDLTEWVFSVMKLKKKTCKKRFICEADQQAKNNSLLALTLYMFSDSGFIKYRPNATIHSMEDCQTIGPKCTFS